MKNYGDVLLGNELWVRMTPLSGGSADSFCPNLYLYGGQKENPSESRFYRVGELNGVGLLAQQLRMNISQIGRQCHTKLPSSPRCGAGPGVVTFSCSRESCARACSTDFGKFTPRFR
jgi:hypothetical protein